LDAPVLHRGYRGLAKLLRGAARRRRFGREGMRDALGRFAMNEDESDDVILLEQRVLDAEELVDDEVELIDDDDFSPTEEVILLDSIRIDPADLEVA
jgi:hypothetical protein